MAYIGRTLSNLLFAAGITLLFVGVSQAVGFSVLGMLASLAAILMLLYAGAVWFGGGQRPARDMDPVLVFDRSLRVASGTRRGENLTSCFPEGIRALVEGCCASALSGNGRSFHTDQNGVRVGYQAVPVRTPDGQIVYGILIHAPESARAPADTVTV